MLSRHPLPVTSECHRRLVKVEQALYAGLPLASAVEMLQAGLADTRYGKTAESLLEQIAERVYLIPLALVQVAGYLRADETKRLDQRFIDASSSPTL